MDTPLVERKRNWISRAMGSVRSRSSTTYSSGTFFNRNRHNSVYSSPEGQNIAGPNNPTGNNNVGGMKMIYDRFARRKSIQSQRMRRQGESSIIYSRGIISFVSISYRTLIW